MSARLSRRSFLAAGALVPAALAAPASNQKPPAAVTLGRTGLKITPFIFGSMITTDPGLVEQAFGMGVTCFTSARDYQNGNNERILGAGLKGKRQKVVLCTESIDMNWKPGVKETTKYDLDNLDTSLRELQTDYVDLWMLHHKDSPADMPDEVLEAVRIARKQGKIRHGGVTTHRLPAIADRLVNQDLLEVVMPIFNFTMDAEMNAAVEKVHKAGLGVIAMKVMAGGLRTDKPVRQMKRPGAPAAALKWAMNHPHVDAAVTSMSDLDQLEDNVKSMREAFTEDERHLLAGVLGDIGPDYCRMCGGCEGTCAKGLPVDEVIRFATYADGYGQFPLGRAKFNELPAAFREVRCGDCPSCTVECRYGVRVAGRVGRAQELFA